MARVITVTGQKGGTGKTTLAMNLAAASADVLGLKTLVLDLDTQANASMALTGDTDILHRTGVSAAAALFENPVRLAPIAVRDNLDLLHGNVYLFEVDPKINLQEIPALRDLLHTTPRPGSPTPWDVIVIDTAPSITARLAVSLALADVVILPAEPTSIALSGVNGTIELLKEIKASTNPDVDFRLVLNRYQPRRNAHRQKLAELERVAPLAAVFHSLTAVEEALEEGMAVWQHPKGRTVGKPWLDFCLVTLRGETR